MDWLLAHDTALFHFLNTSFVNPFFDRLMPALSGYHVPWLAAVIFGVPVLLCFGSVRLRVCLTLMVLVVALGDPLVIGTVKDSVLRPRPFVVLKDARLYVPQTRRFDTNGIGYVAPLPDGTLPANANRHSFPSAHAANWFAIATVGFLFYRRSAFWMFLLAAAVAFSRVYNGVHYPGDITAGAILGAGYAVALVVLVQMLWNIIGRKYFPKTYARLPNLLQPETVKAESGKLNVHTDFTVGRASPRAAQTQNPRRLAGTLAPPSGNSAARARLRPRRHARFRPDLPLAAD